MMYGKNGIPVVGLMHVDDLADYLEMQNRSLKDQIQTSADEYRRGAARSAREFLAELDGIQKTPPEINEPPERHPLRYSLPYFEVSPLRPRSNTRGTSTQNSPRAERPELPSDHQLPTLQRKIDPKDQTEPSRPKGARSTSL